MRQKNGHLGRYNYQIITDGKVDEEGIINIKANLLYSSTVDSYWKKALKAVEDRIAGKAIDPANDITVGDKKITYYSLNQLLELRDFIKQKIAEEDEEEGIETSSPNNGKVMFYKWRSF